MIDRVHTAEILLFALLFTIFWFISGCIVCTMIDDEHRRLLHWADKAPYGLGCLIPLFFPVLLFFYIKNKDKRAK